MIKHMKIDTVIGGSKTVLMAQIMERAVKEFGIERILHLTPHQPIRAQLVRHLNKDITDKVHLCGITRLPKFLPDDLVVLDSIPDSTRFLIETRLKHEAVRVISFHDVWDVR